MTKELTLNQFVRNGGAIDLYKGLLAPQASPMNGPGDQLLAGSTLPSDQDPAVAWRNRLDLLEKLPDRWTVADDLVSAFEVLSEGPVLLQEALLFQAVPDCQKGALDLGRFLDKVIGSHLEGPHGRFDGSMSRDHDHRCLGNHPLKHVKGLQPIHSWKPDI